MNYYYLLSISIRAECCIPCMRIGLGAPEVACAWDCRPRISSEKVETLSDLCFERSMSASVFVKTRYKVLARKPRFNHQLAIQFSSPIFNESNMFSAKSIFSTVTVAVVAAIGVQAESHTVTFDNRCGYGTVSPSIPLYHTTHILTSN